MEQINRQLQTGMGRQAVAISLAVVNMRVFLNPQYGRTFRRFRAGKLVPTNSMEQCVLREIRGYSDRQKRVLPFCQTAA